MDQEVDFAGAEPSDAVQTPLGGLFRSAPMTYVSITMSDEASAHDTLMELGMLAKFHIVDLSFKEAPTRQFLHYKKRANDCSSLLNRMRVLREDVMEKEYKIKVPLEVERPQKKDGDIAEQAAAWLVPIENDLATQEAYITASAKEINEDLERQKVLQVMANAWERLFREGGEIDVELGSRRGAVSDFKGDHDHKQALVSHDNFRSELAGVLPTDKIALFQRLVYRISRGNAFVRFTNIEEPIVDPVTGDNIQKSVFLVLVVGSELINRIRKAVAVMGATAYSIPKGKAAMEDVIKQLKNGIVTKRGVLETTKKSVASALRAASETDRKVVDYEDGRRIYRNFSPIRDWEASVRQERAVCEAMMKCYFDLHNEASSLIGLEGWVPTVDLRKVQAACRKAAEGSGAPPPVVEANPENPRHRPTSPPTYFKLDKVSEVFQDIVNTYGVPRYGEVNPGVFTIVTFPFLFGVMYGDIGHGSFLALFGLFLIWNEKKLAIQKRRNELDEITSMAFAGRYALFMMGLFGVYCGIIYNDCMSVPVSLYKSSWTYSAQDSTNKTSVYDFNGSVYPVGIDPHWYGANNELAFLNSFKMKLAVTLGVIHMLFGIFLSLMNHLHFGDITAVWFEFIPRVIFLSFTFGYMVVIILIKFTVDWSQGGAPPNLIQTMIQMFLSPGSVSDELYSGQATVQVILLLVALFTIPVMLCGKPCVNKQKHKNDVLHEPHEEHEAQDLAGDEEAGEHKSEVHRKMPQLTADANNSGGAGGHGDGPYSFSDDMIHQAIHTIEFVLGCVSNTASYLRLWALSLAHSELATVFWEKMIMEYGIEMSISMGNPIFVFVGFAVWFAATFGVLLSMDVLECFLHALRLHWVEFQNKFFYADGYQFEPFSLHPQ